MQEIGQNNDKDRDPVICLQKGQADMTELQGSLPELDTSKEKAVFVEATMEMEDDIGVIT